METNNVIATKKSKNAIIPSKQPTKEQLKQKLRDKLRNKQTSRLSRHARDLKIESLEKKMKGAKGKEKMEIKKQIHFLEDIDAKEMDSEGVRTIPSYD